MPKTISERRDTLQQQIGPFPVVVIETFENWGKTQRMKVLSVRPKNVEEVIRVVKAANSLLDVLPKEPQFTIRCVGDAHSWSPLFPDEGNILMYTADLTPSSGKRIVLNEPTQANGNITVTIAPGVTTGELSEFFERNNVCLKSDVILDKVTFGGVIATGCHGVGKDEMSVSDKVVGMTLVGGNGDKKTYDFTVDPIKNLEYYNSLKCNLGLFGVMTDITLKVEPMVIVKVENDFSLTVGDVFYNPSKLKDLYDENWSLEIFWFPYNSLSWLGVMTIATTDLLNRLIRWKPENDRLWIRKINIVEVPDKPCLSATDYDFKSAQDLVSTTFGRLISESLNRQPSLVPSFLKAGFEMVERFNQKPPHFELINRAIHYQGFLEVFPVVDMEFAFNMDEDFVDQAKAMQVVVKECENLYYKWRPEFPLSVAMEMRWIASSEALMCPARAVSNKNDGGSGKTLYLEVLGIAGQLNNTWEDFTSDVASEWMEIKSGGKSPVPHWAKQWSYIPGIDLHIQTVYGKALETFKEKCQENAPMFTNETLDKVIFQKAKAAQAKPKSKPTAKPSVEGRIAFDELQFNSEDVQSWKEFWVSVGEQTWSIPNAAPRMNIEREWKVASGLFQELGFNPQMILGRGKRMVDRDLVHEIFDW